MVYQCTATVHIARDVQEIADSLGKVEDWEGLASRLGVGRGDINTIKENCDRPDTRAQCCRRELVKTYCDWIGGDPERVKSDIRESLESGKRGGKNYKCGQSGVQLWPLIMFQDLWCKMVVLFQEARMKTMTKTTCIIPY